MEKINKLLLTIFIFLQIIFDMLRTTSIIDIEFLGLSVIELINIVFSLTIFGIAILKSRKNFKTYLIYFIILGIYLVLHYYNTTLFNPMAYKNQTPSFLIETYHILITYLIPILIMISIIEMKIKKEELISLIKYFAFSMSFLIVILNLFKLSYVAYENGGSFLKYNFLDWFTYNGNNYYELTSKGWFYSTNQISAILLMSLPILVYSLYQDRKIHNFIFLGIQILAMYMLGTKVASLGIFLVFISFFLIYLFTSLVLNHDNKKITAVVIVAIIGGCCFLVSPLGISLRGEQKVYEKLSDKDEFQKLYTLNCKDEKVIQEEKDYILDIISKYQENLNISSYILNAYPVLDDLSYWCTFLNNKNLPVNDYRVMKSNILHSIYERNNNKYDKLLGMGYTLNFIYTEKDYSYQFYIYGILGLLLLVGPFYLVNIKSLVEIFRNLKTKGNILNLILLMIPFIGLLTSYYSGHILERSFPLLTIAIFSGLAYKAINQE